MKMTGHAVRGGEDLEHGGRMPEIEIADNPRAAGFA